MENKNGYGIFYGVIGVATLVVSIIGATFAYFSSTINAVNDVTAGSTELKLEILQEVTTGLKSDLIPVDTHTGEGNNYFPLYPGTEATKCKDDSNNSICSVYQFTISNPNTTVAQTVYGYLDITENGFSNLKFAIFRGTSAEVAAHTNKFDVNGYKAAAVPTAGADFKTNVAVGTLVWSPTSLKNSTLAGESAAYGKETLPTVSTGQEKTVVLTNLTEELEKTSETTSKTVYTVVVWLEETGTVQDEQKKTFAANIRFDTGNGQGVTGSLSASGGPVIASQ